MIAHNFNKLFPWEKQTTTITTE